MKENEDHRQKRMDEPFPDPRPLGRGTILMIAKLPKHLDQKQVEDATGYTGFPAMSRAMLRVWYKYRDIGFDSFHPDTFNEFITKYIDVYGPIG